MLIAAAPKLREQCMGCSTSSERDVAALEDFIADHKRNEKLVKDLKSTNAETRALNVEKTTRDLHPLFDKVEQHAKNKTLDAATYARLQREKAAFLEWMGHPMRAETPTPNPVVHKGPERHAIASTTDAGDGRAEAEEEKESDPVTTPPPVEGDAPPTPGERIVVPPTHEKVKLRLDPPPGHHECGLGAANVDAIVKFAKGHPDFGSLFTGEDPQEQAIVSFLQQMRVVFGDPSENDGWGPNLQGRYLYKDTLQQMFCQSVEFADLIEVNQKVRTTGLLFGPSGTGKSEAARALASKLSCVSDNKDHGRGYAFYLQIESGRILTRWFGQSERQVLALFELSKIVTKGFGACLVVLIDEIDGLCSESPDAASSRLVYQFQTSFSSLPSLQKDVGRHKAIFLGTTNKPYNISTPIRDRFDAKIFVPLPDESERLTFFKAKAKLFKSALSDTEYRSIAKYTSGLTYRQLNDIWVAAVDRCNEEAIAAARRNRAPLDRSAVRPVVYADLERGFNMEQQDAPVDLWCPCDVCKARGLHDRLRLAEFDVQYGNATKRPGPFLSLVACDGSFLTLTAGAGEVFDVTENFKPHPQSRFVFESAGSDPSKIKIRTCHNTILAVNPANHSQGKGLTHGGASIGPAETFQIEYLASGAVQLRTPRGYLRAAQMTTTGGLHAGRYLTAEGITQEMKFTKLLHHYPRPVQHVFLTAKSAALTALSLHKEAAFPLHIWQLNPTPIPPPEDAAPFAPDINLNLRVAMWKGDMLSLKANAFVCGSDGDIGSVGYGMAVKLWSMTGRDPVVEAAAKSIPVGGAASVRASGDLAKHCDWVVFGNGPIHTVPPLKRLLGTKPTENHAMRLADTYISILNTAKALGVRSICIPGISTGVNGYPVAEAAPIAVRSTRQWLQTEGNTDCFDLIIFVVYTTDEEAWHVYKTALHHTFPRSCIGSPLEDLDVDVDAMSPEPESPAAPAAAVSPEPVAPVAVGGAGSA